MLSWNSLSYTINTCNKDHFKATFQIKTDHQKSTNTHKYCDFLLSKWKDRARVWEAKFPELTRASSWLPSSMGLSSEVNELLSAMLWDIARGEQSWAGACPPAQQHQCPMPGLPISLCLPLLWPSVARAWDWRPPWPWIQSTYRSFHRSSYWDQLGYRARPCLKSKQQTKLNKMTQDSVTVWCVLGWEQIGVQELRVQPGTEPQS